MDRSDGHLQKILTLTIEQFVKRFLLHLLPKGLRKIRYFGYMANRNRSESLMKVRRLILESGCQRQQSQVQQEHPMTPDSSPIPSEVLHKNQCKLCGQPMRRQRPIALKVNIVEDNRHGPDPNLIAV